MISKVNKTKGVLSRLLPWAIAMVLGGFLLTLILVIHPGQSKRLGGYSTALSSTAIELYKHDFEQEPGILHVLDIGEDTHSPVRGVMVHGIALDPSYKHDECYRNAMRNLACRYNLITLGQACHLAMNGEDSLRVRYVLKKAEELYQGSYESELLTNLPALHEGNTEVRCLFARVESYGLGLAQWRVKREDLLHPLTNSVRKNKEQVE